MGLYSFHLKKKLMKIEKKSKSWEPFSICLLASTVNQAQFMIFFCWICFAT